MANRHRDFNKLVAAKFENIDFAQAYIMNLINDEKMNLEEALRETIVSMGLQAFASKAEVSIQHISDFVNKRRRFTTDTIDKYLHKAFNLKIKITVEPTGTKVA